MADGVGGAYVFTSGAGGGSGEGVAAHQASSAAVGLHGVGQRRIGVAVNLALAGGGRDGDRPRGDGDRCIGGIECWQCVIAGQSTRAIRGVRQSNGIDVLA